MRILASRSQEQVNNPVAPVFIDGKKAQTLRGSTIARDFQALVEGYVQERFSSAGNKAA